MNDNEDQQGAKDAEKAAAQARVRRGPHVAVKGHRIEVHRDDSVVQVRLLSRRAPERNKYADAPRGTMSAKKRARLEARRTEQP